MKKHLSSIFLFILCSITFSACQPQAAQTSQTTVTQQSTPIPTEIPLPFTAHFAIYTNGTFRVFTAAMYHNLSDDVYITAENPNQIIVNKLRATWNDFFSSLPFSLTEDCLVTGTGQQFCDGQNGQLSFYLNGESVNNLLSRNIKPNDMLLVRFGKDDQQLQQELQKLTEISQ